MEAKKPRIRYPKAGKEKKETGKRALKFRRLTRMKDWWERVRGKPDMPLNADNTTKESCHGEISDEDIKLGLKHVHENLGHRTKDELCRMLRLGKARERALQLAKEFKCDECERHKGPRLSRSVKVRRTHRFNEEVMLDLIECG